MSKPAARWIVYKAKVSFQQMPTERDQSMNPCALLIWSASFVVSSPTDGALRFNANVDMVTREMISLLVVNLGDCPGGHDGVPCLLESCRSYEGRWEMA